MKIDELYSLIDIETPSDFKYYENLELLLENDKKIDSYLLEELFYSLNWEKLIDLFKSYFDEVIRILPDNEDDLYIKFDVIKRKFLGILEREKDRENVKILVSEIESFKKWFIEDRLVKCNDDKNASIYDAIYDIYASKLLNNDCKYDFSNINEYKIDAFEIKISKLI